jgi:hypothetical protein
LKFFNRHETEKSLKSRIAMAERAKSRKGNQQQNNQSQPADTVGSEKHLGGDDERTVTDPECRVVDKPTAPLSADRTKTFSTKLATSRIDRHVSTTSLS